MTTNTQNNYPCFTTQELSTHCAKPITQGGLFYFGTFEVIPSFTLVTLYHLIE